MTTIAWDGKTLAVDSGVWRSTDEQCLFSYRENKLRKHEYQSSFDGRNRVAYWCFGGRNETLESVKPDVERFIETGKGRLPLAENTPAFTILILRDEGLYEVGQSGIFERVGAEKVSVGGDWDIAHVAMRCGKDAIEALRICEELGSRTKAPYRWVTFKNGYYETGVCEK